MSQQVPGAPEVRHGLLLLTCGFSPPALGLGCVLLPPAQGRATGLIGITKPLSHTDTQKKGSYLLQTLRDQFTWHKDTDL